MNIFKRVLSAKNIILLQELVRTDFKLRYQNSILGYAWSLLRPLFLFMILYGVFVKFLKLGGSIDHYPVYLLLGIVLWTFFAEVTSQSINSIVGRGDLIRKIKIPHWIILVSTSLSALINLALNLLIVFVFVFINHVHLTATAPLLLLPIAELYLFAFGLALWLSSLYVKFRDVIYIWEIMMQGLFYLTPIIYVVSLVPQTWMKKVILMSPVAQAIQTARYDLITHNTDTLTKVYGGPIYLLIPFGVLAVVLISGILYFRKESKYFAENI